MAEQNDNKVDLTITNPPQTAAAPAQPQASALDAATATPAPSPDENDQEFSNWMKQLPAADRQAVVPERDEKADNQEPPPPAPAHDDASDDYARHRRMGEDAASDEEFNQWMQSVAPQGRTTAGGNTAPDTGTSPPPSLPTPPEPLKTPKSKSILLDVLHGLGAAPHEIQGGVLDAVDGLNQAADRVGQYIHSFLPEGTPFAYNSETGKFLSKEDFEALPQEKLGSHIPLPDTVTGGMIRGMAQFLTGFALTGTAGKAVGVGPALTRAGQVTQGLMKGALTDSTFFDSHSKNLGNLIQEFPKLRNPVTEFLATAPSDSDAEGRFKNALTGLLGGLATEGAIQGFAAGLRFIQRAGGSNAIADMIAKYLGKDTSKAVKEVQPHELEGLGDPNGALFEKRAAEKIVEGENAIAESSGKSTEGEPYHINFAAINTSDDVKDVLQKMATREKKAIEEGKSGVQTWEKTESMADSEDAWKLLVDRNKGEPLPAHELLAVKKFYIASGEKLTQMAQLASEVPTDANVFLFQKMAAVHAMVQKEFLNAGSEVGRALNILRCPVGSSRQMAEQLEDILNAVAGSKQNAQAVAAKVAKLTRAGRQDAIDTFVNGVIGKKYSDAIAQAYVNGLLGPATVTVKLVSDMAFAAQQVMQRQTGAYISQRLGTQGGVEMGEALAMMHGGISAFKDAMYALAQHFKDAPSLSERLRSPEAAIQQVSKDVKGAIPFELPESGKLAAENWGITSDYKKAGIPWGKIADFADVATRFNSRVIGTVDQFSKMIGYRMELHAQALRQATQELKGGTLPKEEFYKRIADIIADPPKAIREASVDQAMYQTFTSEPAEVLKRLGNAIQSVPIIGRIMLPFKNTPINIMTQTFEGTPLAPLVKTWRADLAAGGARADLAIAKVTTGTAIMQMAMDMAFRGVISGRGPQHPGERAEWTRLGNQPYSLTLPGGTKIAFSRLDPLGFTLGIGADIAESIVNAEKHIEDRDFSKVMTGAAFAIGNNVMSKTYMMGTAELVNALSNSEGRGDAYIKHVLGSLVPFSSAVGTATRAVDPYARTADSMMDALYRKIPGLSSKLPLQRNLWGEPLSYRSPLGWAYDAFSPYWLKSVTPAPIDKELERLEYYPSMPERRIHVGGGTALELSSEQYSHYVDLAGNALKDPAKGGMGARDYLNSVVTGKNPFSPIYQSFVKNDKVDGGDRAKTWVENTIRQYREKAKAKMMGEDTSLQMAYDDKNAHRPGKVPARFKFIGQ